MTGLVAFLAASRERNRRWLARELSAAPPSDIARTIAEEEQRGREFAERAAARVAGETPAILAIPDAQLRQAKLAASLEREKRYARQRGEAMAVRAIAALGRVQLRTDSPAGAYWKLDPTVKEHTPGCLFLGERFWPWAVLDRVHPPRHAGCPCRLMGLHEAVLAGLMRPEDVPNAAGAVRAAAGVVMEAEEATRLAAELELREALVEQGVDAATLDAIPLAEDFDPAEKRDVAGRWSKGAAAVEELVTKPWTDPPAPVGKTGERAGAGGYSSDKAYGTNTELGRAGEQAFVKIVGGRVLHPEGKGEQSPLDVHFDGLAFEVKAVSRRSLAYKATPKPYEQDQKEAAAKELGVKPALAMVVMDSEGKRAHAYYREGLKGGRLSQRTGWKYLGSAAI